MKKLFLLFTFVFPTILPVSSFADIEIKLYLNNGCSVQESFASKEFINVIEASDTDNVVIGEIKTNVNFYFGVLCDLDDGTEKEFMPGDIFSVSGIYSSIYMSFVNIDEAETVPSANQNVLGTYGDSNNTYYDVLQGHYGLVETKVIFSGD